MRLRIERKKLRLTQAKLGELIGCGSETISKIENKTRIPSKVMRHKLEKHFNLSVEELLEGDLPEREEPIIEYALYRGEEVLAIGTKNEIARTLGIKPETVLFYGTPSYRKRRKTDDRRILIRLDEEE